MNSPLYILSGGTDLYATLYGKDVTGLHNYIFSGTGQIGKLFSMPTKENDLYPWEQRCNVDIKNTNQGRMNLANLQRLPEITSNADDLSEEIQIAQAAVAIYDLIAPIVNGFQTDRYTIALAKIILDPEAPEKESVFLAYNLDEETEARLASNNEKIMEILEECKLLEKGDEFYVLTNPLDNNDDDDSDKSGQRHIRNHAEMQLTR